MVGSQISTSTQEFQRADSGYVKFGPHASGDRKEDNGLQLQLQASNNLNSENACGAHVHTKKRKDPDELEGYKMYNGSYTRDLGNNEGDSNSRETDNSFANSSPPSSVGRTMEERNGIPSPANSRIKDNKNPPQNAGDLLSKYIDLSFANSSPSSSLTMKEKEGNHPCSPRTSTIKGKKPSFLFPQAGKIIPDIPEGNGHLQTPRDDRIQRTLKDERNLHTFEDDRIPNTHVDNRIPNTPGENRNPNTPVDNRIPNSPGDDRIPNRTEDNRIPNSPGDDRIPNTTKDNRIPNTHGDNRIPHTPGVNRIQNTHGDNRIPNTPGENKIPHTPGDNRTPHTPGDNKIPNSPGDDRIPNTTEDNRIPYSPADDKIPNTTEDNIIPNTHGDNRIPHTARDNRIPNTHGDNRIPNTPEDNRIQNTHRDNRIPIPPEYIDIDDKVHKNKGCWEKIKKFIKFAIPFSFLVAIIISTLLYTKTTDLSNTITPKIEALKDSQNKDSGEINKTLSTAVQNLHQRIEDIQTGIDTMYRNLITFNSKALQDLGNLMRIYLISNSGGGCGETCINVTSGSCVNDCSNITDGNYQSCHTCHGYVSCVNQQIHNMRCSAEKLIWDDSVKRCEWTSSTCDKKE